MQAHAWRHYEKCRQERFLTALFMSPDGVLYQRQDPRGFDLHSCIRITLKGTLLLFLAEDHRSHAIAGGRFGSLYNGNNFARQFTRNLL
jgi:hypothetical protein